VSKRECIDCGSPATVQHLEAYGPGRPEDYCTVCFISNNAPGVDAPIHTSVYGEDAQVTTLVESDSCDNCGVSTIAGIKHGEPFVSEDAAFRAFLRTPESHLHPQSEWFGFDIPTKL
jgi:hypothetical protein